jgi:hypothetical protein
VETFKKTQVNRTLKKKDTKGEGMQYRWRAVAVKEKRGL